MTQKTAGILIAASLVLPVAAFGQVDTSDWACEYCPFEEGYRAEVDAGGLYVTEDSARFGNGTGLDEEGGYLDLSGNGRYVKDGTEVTWYAEDLGTKSRVFNIAAGKPGKFSVGLNYSELPYRLYDTTSTVFTDAGSGVLTLPGDWVAAGTTDGFTALGRSLTPVTIGTDRQILEFGAKYLPTQKVRLYADYSRQQRDGTGIMTGAQFTQAAYLPRPIDDYTDQMNAGVRFALGPVNLGLAYYGSFYRNKRNSLTWDNPYTSGPGGEQGRLALEPDNDFQQLSFSGVWRTDSYNTVVAFSTAFGRGEQSTTFLPYTINSMLPVTALPAPSLDGQVDTSNYAFTITSRPHRLATVKFAFRHDERDNQTPVSMWSRVITDGFPVSSTEANIPYSFERDRLNVSASLRVLDTLRLSGGYDRVDYDRDYQEVAEQTEDTGWGKLRWRPTGYLEASLRGGTSRREIGAYNTTLAESFGQNPLMRKYNLAHRYREFAEVSLSASLPEKPVSLGVSYLWAEDDYSKSELGLTEGEENRFNVDLSWAITETGSLYLSAGSEELDAMQTGSESFTGPLWFATHEDAFDHYGGGFRLAGLGDRIDITADYTRSEGETDITTEGSGVSDVPLPTIKSVMDSLRVALNYRASEKMDINLGIRYEHLDVSDWALDGVNPATIPVVLTMGANAFDHDVWVVGVGVRYRIGAAATP